MAEATLAMTAVAAIENFIVRSAAEGATFDRKKGAVDGDDDGNLSTMDEGGSWPSSYTYFRTNLILTVSCRKNN